MPAGASRRGGVRPDQQGEMNDDHAPPETVRQGYQKFQELLGT